MIDRLILCESPDGKKTHTIFAVYLFCPLHKMIDKINNSLWTITKLKIENVDHHKIQIGDVFVQFCCEIKHSIVFY